MTSIILRKMRHTGAPELVYYLGDTCMSTHVGSTITLQATGHKQCLNCDRDIRKTFQQGYCYPCFQGLARCDVCIVRPEKCHYQEGTCREPEWGEEHCLIEHVVYLANTTGVKVGVTGAHKIDERWGDQGAHAAVVIARVPERRIAGEIEVALKGEVADRTDWRGLIKGVCVEVDLEAERKRLSALVPAEYQQYLVEGETDKREIRYPVREYPEKAKTINLDKEPLVSGVLQGIRGQYLFIDGRGLNVRKFGGYEVQIGFEQ
jgi:hypothetical protein